MRHPALFFGLVLLSVPTGCHLSTGPGGDSDPPVITQLPRNLTIAENRLLQSGNAFGFDLLRAVRSAEPGANAFLSPLSASMALGMALNGAEDETFEEMRAALRFEGIAEPEINQAYRTLIDLLQGLDPRVSFRIGNSLWHRTGWTPESPFLATLDAAFDAEVAGLDFSSPEAAETMNDWVREATGGRIEGIVEPPIDPLTILFLINAIDFDGPWTVAFEPAATRQDTFHNADGTTGSVRLMERRGEVAIASTPELDAVDLPYGGEAFSMTILLPRGDRTPDDLLRDLTPERWEELTAAFQEGGDVIVRIPRFRMAWEATLNTALAELGMVSAFDPSAADFTRMFADARDLGVHVSEVKQKTFVEVDEAGTRASAATSVEIGIVSAPPTFTANRPFLFAIRERLSGAILFVGVIVEAPENAG